MPAWAPGFSAFGCACGEYAYRYDKTLDMALLPGDDAGKRRAVAEAIIAAWDELKLQVNAEFEKSGVRPEAVSYRPAARMLYYGQLNDLEVPVEDDYGSNLEEMLDGLCNGFEAEYGKMYGLAARTPQFGYMVTAGDDRVHARGEAGAAGRAGGRAGAARRGAQGQAQHLR